MLVLTGMNYGNKATLYEEAKKSLQKFKGDITEGQRGSERLKLSNQTGTSLSRRE